MQTPLTGADYLPQIVYYFSAYCDLLKAGTIKEEGDKINVVVPTSNFGNILAAYYAKNGSSIHKLILCFQLQQRINRVFKNRRIQS